MMKTKISLSFNDQKGKKGKEYANCITRQLVSLQKTQFSQAAFYLPDLSNLNPYLFSSPITNKEISSRIMEVNYSRWWLITLRFTKNKVPMKDYIRQISGHHSLLGIMCFIAIFALRTWLIAWKFLLVLGRSTCVHLPCNLWHWLLMHHN